MNYLNFFNEDLPIAIGLILGSIMAGIFGYNQLCIILVIILLIVVWFYRSPNIDIPPYYLQSNELYAPSYGTVEKITHLDTGRYLVEVKLELWDVHIQYFPTSGEVYEQIYGPYSVATKLKNLMWGANPHDREIYVTQKTGYVARRIATPYCRGQVFAGNRLGMIKFGSHVDIEFSDKYVLQVNVGDPVYGPYTLIAKWKDTA